MSNIQLCNLALYLCNNEWNGARTRAKYYLDSLATISAISSVAYHIQYHTRKPDLCSKALLTKFNKNTYKS